MRWRSRALSGAVGALAMLGLVTAVVSPAAADDVGGHNNVVNAVSGPGGSGQVAASLAVSFDPSGIVDNQQLAFARSACDGCRTVAVALQVIVAEGPVSTATQFNGAVALNDQCTGCSTLAYANQVLLQTPGPARLDMDGQQEVSQIESEMATVAQSGEDFGTMIGQLDALASQLDATVTQDLIAQHAAPQSERDDRQVQAQ